MSGETGVITGVVVVLALIAAFILGADVMDDAHNGRMRDYCARGWMTDQRVCEAAKK